MSSRILTITAATLFAAAPAFCAQQQQNNNASESNGQNQQSNREQNQNERGHENGRSGQKAPEGYVFLEERVVYEMANQPQEHLLRAHEQLAQNNPKAAAAELRLAANYLKMQESRPGDNGKQELSPWIHRIDELSHRISNGDSKAEKQLVKDSADASFALAKYFDQRATHELQKNKEVQAGYDLSAAAGNFEQALIWSQQKPERNEVSAIADARRAADQLVTAENLQSGQASENRSGEAQQAGARINGADQNEIKSATQAAQQLTQTIDSQSSKFSASPESENGQSANGQSNNNGSGNQGSSNNQNGNQGGNGQK